MKENNTFKGYIYKITNNINNKIYIGQTRVSLNKRFSQHIRRSQQNNKYNSRLYEAMRKYGISNFTIELIETISSCIKELHEREKYWISYFNSTNKSIGYNIDIGGRGGDVIHLLPEERQIEIKSKLREINLGKSQSQETINKRVLKLKGRITITDGKVTKRIHKSELEYYLQNGWRLGIKDSDKGKSTKWQQDPTKKTEASKKISKKCIGKFKNSKIMTSPEGVIVRIPCELENDYLAKGYSKGFPETSRVHLPKIQFKKDGKVTYATFDKFNHFIEMGWIPSKRGLKEYEKQQQKE